MGTARDVQSDYIPSSASGRPARGTDQLVPPSSGGRAVRRPGRRSPGRLGRPRPASVRSQRPRALSPLRRDGGVHAAGPRRVPRRPRHPSRAAGNARGAHRRLKWHAQWVSPAPEDLLASVEARRQAVSSRLSAAHRAKFGQFFTPPLVADFLAGLIELPAEGPFRLLDPGAGVGSLTAAVVGRAIREQRNVELHVTAFEVDDEVVPHLAATLDECVEGGAQGVEVVCDLRPQSFVDAATGWLPESPLRFDGCIMNPPYRKVNTRAPERVAAGTVGLRASNLYTIFVGLAADLLDDNGQLSAIVPRSFANGPYHEPFRRFLLERMSLDFVHVYDSRGDVFADAEVLQENVVLRARRAPQSPAIALSTSKGAAHVRTVRRVPAAEVLRPGDPHVFVRLPTTERDTLVAEALSDLPATLTELGLTVSTGRVVDFRSRESLRQDPDADTAPLIYPGHLRAGRIVWPLPGSRKPNALRRDDTTAALLLPNETFVVVRRFSAKEERRRVVAAVSGSPDVPGDVVAFENHLNVFHRQSRGLPAALAWGLSGFLNSTLVDDYVRTFSGHTQINATDLRQLRYPSKDELVALGTALMKRSWPGQDTLDELIASHVAVVGDATTSLAKAA